LGLLLLLSDLLAWFWRFVDQGGLAIFFGHLSQL
jgi:hypothetical protein